MKILYSASVVNGGLKIRGRKQFDAELLSLEGKEVLISIEKKKKTRSNLQNAFYWSGFLQSQIDCFHEQYGEMFDKEQIHNWNKNNFFCTEIADNNTGEIIKIPRSTTTYTTTEFEERLEAIRQRFKEAWNWTIPLPNEQLALI